MEDERHGDRSLGTGRLPEKLACISSSDPGVVFRTSVFVTSQHPGIRSVYGAPPRATRELKRALGSGTLSRERGILHVFDFSLQLGLRL